MSGLPARREAEIPGAPPTWLKKKTMIKDLVGSVRTTCYESSFGALFPFFFLDVPNCAKKSRKLKRTALKEKIAACRRSDTCTAKRT